MLEHGEVDFGVEEFGAYVRLGNVDEAIAQLAADIEDFPTNPVGRHGTMIFKCSGTLIC